MSFKTPVEEQLNKAIMLSDSIAWFETHTEEVKQIILDYIRDDQLYEGVDSNNSFIGFYSYWTEVISDGKKRMGDPYTLEDTGAFYRSMFIKVLNDSIVIDADYVKVEDQDWWRIDILGLTEENLENYAELVKDNFITYARRVLELD